MLIGHRRLLLVSTGSDVTDGTLAEAASQTMPPMDKVDVVVIGAGVVGLASRARARAEQAVEVVVAGSRGRPIGTGVSSRNSEVIHAGMYYAAGSLKARAVRATGSAAAVRLLRRTRHRRTAAAAS